MSLNNLEEVNNFITSNNVCFLFFNKTNSGCGACDVLYSKLLNLKNEFSDIEIGLILDNPQLASNFNIFSTPFVIMYIEGKELFREGVYTSIDEIKRILYRYKID